MKKLLRLQPLIFGCKINTPVSPISINPRVTGITKHACAVLVFALTMGGIGQYAAAEEQSLDKSMIIIKRSKAFSYSGLAARISVNGDRKIKLKNGKTTQLSVSPGRNVLEVKAFAVPGSSTISFNTKPGETYELEVSVRKGKVWAGVFGGYLALAVINAANAESTEGGGFRIKMASTSETEAQEAKLTQIVTPPASKQETDTGVTGISADEAQAQVKLETDEGGAVKGTVEIEPRVTEVKEEKESKKASNEESSDLYQTLLELDDLRQRGILSEEEFQNEKKKVLDGE